MRTVIILRGLPGCGKSTYARELLRKEAKRWKRFNRDDLRNMMDDGTFNSDREEFVRSVQDQLILKAIRDGYDIIVDNTHLVPQTLRKLHRLLASIGDVKAIEKCFNVSVDECKKRNVLREGRARVPENVIDGMAKGAGIDRGRVLEDKEFYYPPREQATDKYVGDESLPRAVIFDNDGTISLIHAGRSPYDASTCDMDKPHKHVIECMKLYYNAGYKILFVSGREDKDRAPTERFYHQHFPEVKYELFMRKTGDARKDVIIKEEIFNEYIKDKYFVAGWFDDRLQVSKWVHASGLPLFRVNDPEANF